MPRYESIREPILNNLSLYPFELCTEEEIVKERIEGVPEDYLDFLKGVGYGWALVEIWHDDNLSLHYREEQSFEEFVRRLFEPNQ